MRATIGIYPLFAWMFNHQKRVRGKKIDPGVLLGLSSQRLTSQRREKSSTHVDIDRHDNRGGMSMFRNVGIATAGVAIGLPVWGIALAVGGAFVAGAAVGFIVAGPAGALAGGTVAIAS